MSKFLDRLEEITQGTPPPMGFGAPRGQKTPGMAFVGLVSESYSEGIRLLGDLGPDAILISGTKDPQSDKELTEAIGSGTPWGSRVSSLTEEEAQSFEAGGCDILAFSLSGTSLAAVASEEMTRVLCVDPDIETDRIGPLDALPVDVLLLSMSGISAPWTLEDLASIARIRHRVNKYILLELSEVPGAKELETLRNTGVHGLVVDVGKVNPEKLAELKQALLDMPRQRPSRKEKAAALLPRSAFSLGGRERDPEPEEDE
jgi:hypothetical protein